MTFLFTVMAEFSFVFRLCGGFSAYLVRSTYTLAAHEDLGVPKTCIDNKRREGKAKRQVRGIRK